MAKTSEQSFLDYIKTAEEGEVTVREDPPGIPPQNTEAIRFSDAAQESNKDGKEEQAARLFDSKASADTANRALIGAVLDTRDFETSAVGLKPVEKISHPRQQTLMEKTRAVCGRI